MALENINYDNFIHKKFKKCEFCGKELEPIGLDYLYVNISPESIEYQRCTCDKSKEYWKEKDKQDAEEQYERATEILTIIEEYMKELNSSC